MKSKITGVFSLFLSIICCLCLSACEGNGSKYDETANDIAHACAAKTIAYVNMHYSDIKAYHNNITSYEITDENNSWKAHGIFRCRDEYGDVYEAVFAADGDISNGDYSCNHYDFLGKPIKIDDTILVSPGALNTP